MRSRTDGMTLADLVARLARSTAVEAVLTLGSARHGAPHPASDYDLLLILSEMPAPHHVLLTTVDGRLADVLFAPSALIDRVVAGNYERAATAYEGALVEWLKTGELVHDRDGRVRQAQALLAGRDWRIRPGDREVYLRAVHGIHYNYQQNQRYLAYGDPVHVAALEIRLRYSLAQVIFGYFLVRSLPWTGEKAAIEHWAQHDPETLSRFETYHVTADLRERFTHYAGLAQRALEPVGSKWPRDAVNVVLEGEAWELRDIEAAISFWHGLLV